jgi:hypothetical protein
MKETMRTQIEADVFRDRAADDGWPEDAGLRPLEGGTPDSDQYWREPVARPCGDQRAELSGNELRRFVRV